MRRSLEEGSLSNRNSVLYSLEGMRLKIKRTTESSISVEHPAMTRNIRLKGTIYEKHFQGLAQRVHLMKDRQKDYDGTSESRGYRDFVIWRKGMKMKKEYHENLYGSIEQLEPLEISSKLTLSDSQNKSTTNKNEINKNSPRYSYTPSL